MSRIIQNDPVMINSKEYTQQVCSDCVRLIDNETKEVIAETKFTDETIQTILKENQ